MSDELDIDEERVCRLCKGPLAAVNKVGVCRTLPECRVENDRLRSHKSPQRQHRETELLPEDGIVDDLAVQIAANGIRKVALTHRERVLATKIMLSRGCGMRDLCDNLHIQPKSVRKILSELGYKCIRDKHVVGSKVMVIVPKDI